MTYKNMLLGKSKYLVLFLIAIQSILLALMAIFFTGLQYNNTWDAYNKNSQTVTLYLKNLSESQTQEAFHYFQSRQDLSVWTHRTESDPNGNGIKKTYIDAMGNPKNFSNLIFHDRVIVSQHQFNQLLSNEDYSMTIGLDKSTKYTLYPLPDLWLTLPVVVDRLEQVYQKTNRLAGIYHVNGLQNAQKRQQFLEDLSTITGISVNNLTKESFGSYRDQGLTAIILIISLLIIAFIIFILLTIFVLNSFKNFGTLIFLGWGRKELWIALFSDFFLFSLYITPLVTLTIWLLSGYYTFGLSMLISIFFGSSLSLILISLSALFPSLILYSVSILSAIHNRIPHRLLLGLTTFLYLIISCGLLAVSYSLDSPLKTFVDNVQLSKEWKRVEEVSVISKIVEGDDSGTYAGTTNTLEKSMYQLYQRIGQMEGVYLAQGNYVNQEQLDALAGNGEYNHVPDKPFWYLVYSYNYLKNQGITLTKEDISEINEGVRLYLIPDTLSSEERQKMELYLKESVKVYDGELQTKFTENPRFTFKTYTPKIELLTWSPSIHDGVTTKNAVIFVASPENLYFMESANLYVSGYDGILKLRDKKTLKRVQKIIRNEFSDLSDNNIQFLTVKHYIDGIQKNLGYTFYLFGSIIAFIILMLLVIFWSFVLVYQLLFKERLYVQYFLGFSSFQRYRRVFIFITVLYLLELLVSFLIESKLGYVIATIALLCQFAMLYFYFCRKGNSQIIYQLKEK